MSQTNNPPAFPGEVNFGTDDSHQTGASVGQHHGMKLRDYFAAKAMQGSLSAISSQDMADAVSSDATRLGITESQMLAKSAYKIADAMLAERAKEGGN